MAKVNEIIETNVTTVSPSDCIYDVAKIMTRSDLKVVPVCESGKLRGLITQRNIISAITAFNSDLKRRSAESIMITDIPKVSSGCDMVEAAKIMASHRIHYLPVVQNGGKLVGILTLHGLVKESLTLASMVLARQGGSN